MIFKILIKITFLFTIFIRCQYSKESIKSVGITNNSIQINKSIIYIHSDPESFSSKTLKFGMSILIIHLLLNHSTIKYILF